MLRKLEETRIRRRKGCFDCFSLGLAFSKRAERRLASASTHLRRFHFICPLRKSLTKRRNRNKLHSSFRHSRETPLLGSLAQSVEQRTFNPLVERSSRSRPTTFKTKLPRCFSLGRQERRESGVAKRSRSDGARSVVKAAKPFRGFFIFPSRSQAPRSGGANRRRRLKRLRAD